VDVFLPGTGGAQVHEFNPTQFPPVGLFWTVPVPASGGQVDPTSGSASMRATKVPIFDWTTIQNALFMGNNPPPIPGWISFHVVWKGTGPSSDINSTDPSEWDLCRHIHPGHFSDGLVGGGRRFHLRVGPAGKLDEYVC
jgi:hypothetical protein